MSRTKAAKRKPVDIELARVHRYKLRAKKLGMPKSHWQHFQILTEGRPYCRPPVLHTLLEFIDFIAQPVVLAAAAIVVDDFVRLPRLHDLDLVIALHAHVLIDAGVPVDVVNKMVMDVLVVEERHTRRINRSFEEPNEDYC
jgi:hypothetical protein